MTFGQEYLTHLRVIQNIGMARIDPIMYNGVEIVPIQFLKAVCPIRETSVRITRERPLSVVAFGVLEKMERNLLIMCIIIAAIMLPISKPEHRV